MNTRIPDVPDGSMKVEITAHTTSEHTQQKQCSCALLSANNLGHLLGWGVIFSAKFVGTK